MSKKLFEAVEWTESGDRVIAYIYAESKGQAKRKLIQANRDWADEIRPIDEDEKIPTLS